MTDLSTALGRVKNALASNLGADGVLVLAKGDVAELLALIEKRARSITDRSTQYSAWLCVGVSSR